MPHDRTPEEIAVATVASWTDAVRADWQLATMRIALVALDLPPIVSVHVQNVTEALAALQRAVDDPAAEHERLRSPRSQD